MDDRNRTERLAFPHGAPACARLGIVPFSLGRQSIDHGHGVLVRRRLPFWQVVAVLDGEIEHESGLSPPCRVSAGMALLTFPGIWHRYAPLAGGRATSCWFIFDGSWPQALADQGVLDPRRAVVEVPDRVRLEAVCNETWTAASAGGVAGALAAAQGIARLVFELAGSLGTAGHRPQPGAVERLEAALQAAIAQPAFRLRTWCAREGLGFEALRKEFRRRTGQSPGACFAQLKLAAAKERLERSDDPIAVIAAGLGFDDPYYFSRWFRSLQRLPPSAYRTQFR
jgi:AraC-like DNA-binding protein